MQDWYNEELVKIKVHPEAFSKMSNIRLLFLGRPFVLPRGLKFFGGALKVIRWPSFPLEALPHEIPLYKLVDIQMHSSEIKQLWNGVLFMTKLKFIHLQGSLNLAETPNFFGVPHLVRLYLSGCKSLVKVHYSLGQLKELVEVYLDGCENLEILPKQFETNSLMKLDLGGCKKVAVLPEFGEELLGSLTTLRDLDLSRFKIFYHDKFLKTHNITCPIVGLHVASLTELYLRWCGLNNGSIPDDFGNLSSLILLDLSGNDFVNLPTGCFFGLSELVFLSLNDCKSLKSLPRFPIRLSRLNASNCDSMGPLSSNRELWNLVASPDHECRGRAKYVIYDDNKEDDYFLPWVFNPGECIALRDFFAIIPGYNIPSWFPSKEYCECRREYEIKVEIPAYCCYSEWCRIVVCLLISGADDLAIHWSSKAAEDDYYIHKEWGHRIFLWNDHHHQCIMVMELNEETCWQHFRAHHSNSLNILLSTRYEGLFGRRNKVRVCGWRVICKEEIQEWRHLNHFSQLPSPDTDDLQLPWRVLRKFAEAIHFFDQDEDF